MKIKFFDKIICEGTKEECEAFKEEFKDMLCKLDDELRDTYPMKQTDTNETYFEALKLLNPFVYDKLCYIKELVGDCFIEYHFDHMDLAGIRMRIYADLETKKTKMCALSFIFFTVVFDLEKQYFWKLEE